jgi:hypothetical protein
MHGIKAYSIPSVGRVQIETPLAELAVVRKKGMGMGS